MTTNLLNDIRSYQEDAQRSATVTSGPKQPRTAIAGPVAGYDNSTTPATMIVDDMISNEQRRVIISSDFWAYNGDPSASNKRGAKGLDPYVMRARQTQSNKEYSAIGDNVCIQDAFLGAHSAPIAAKGFANTWVGRRIVSLVPSNRGEILIAPAILQFLQRNPQTEQLEPVARQTANANRKSVPYPCVCVFEGESSRLCTSVDDLRSAILQLAHDDPQQFMPGADGQFDVPPGYTYTLTFAAIDGDGKAHFLPYNYLSARANDTGGSQGRIELTYLIGASRRPHSHPDPQVKEIYCNDGHATLARIEKDQRLWGIMDRAIADPAFKGILVIPGVSLPIGAASVNNLLARSYVQEHYPAWLWPRTSTPPEFEPFAVYSVLQVQRRPNGQTQAINEILPIYTDGATDISTFESVMQVPLHHLAPALGPTRPEAFKRPERDWSKFDLEVRRGLAQDRAAAPSGQPAPSPTAPAAVATAPPVPPALQNFPVADAAAATTRSAPPAQTNGYARGAPARPASPAPAPAPMPLTGFPTDETPQAGARMRGPGNGRLR